MTPTPTLPAPGHFLSPPARRLACAPWLAALALVAGASRTSAGDANRLTYLDSDDPYYVSRDFPRLTTPQWVGEPGVEAVVVLAIDDMRGHEKWEAYLRPILERLKQIDGRAALSIMTCQIKPDQPHLQRWLAEGVSLETHTFDHPCPLLGKSDFAKAKATYDRCVDLMTTVPRNRPVAFRMPCCDSLNTVSPRFFAEIFNRTTPEGRWLSIDSSVFQLFTANDPALPREVALDADGRERFRKYLPADRTFVNTVADYPYPYVIGRLCWEFPCIVPSDWEAQRLHKPANPQTVADMQAAIDATVAKQGTFTLVFHPYEWIRPEQIVTLIDHAVAKHGRKVKFLNFREALERLEKNLLGGQSLRGANGQDAGARLLDLNQDGFLDVVIGNDRVRKTRVWSPATGSWKTSDFPVELVEADIAGRPRDAGVRFGVVRAGDDASMLVASKSHRGAWTFRDGKWHDDQPLVAGLTIDGHDVLAGDNGRDRGVRLRDLDRDGVCELLVGNDSQRAAFGFDRQENSWRRLPFSLPEGTAIVDARGRDAGLRFVDVDEDAYDDVVFSNDERYSIDLFRSMDAGWSRRVASGKASTTGALPPIVKEGTNNGAWFQARHMWVHNETTDRMKDLVDRRAFADLLKEVEPEAKSPEASLRAIRVRPGLTVELVAAEPLVVGPVAFDWGPDGRLWVVEMRDYPMGMDGQGKPGGRIKYLEDTDGDGRYDRATVFLEDLPFPSGVMVWRKGILYTAAPDIVYAEDTDGDGRADVKQVLFHGFGEGNQQHRVNGLRWGLDNWIYCANGDSGGQIESTKTGERVPLSFRDFRIRPDTGQLDPEIGQAQFMRERDDWGNWFGSQNSDPMFQYVLEDHYLRRNRNVPSPNPRNDVSVAPGAAPVFPVSRTLPRFNDFNVANRFTSACSAIVYRDELLGPAFAGNTFVSEPVHNLVHREVMSREGVLFHSRRAADEQQAEFLASSDNWFRPTMVRTGPDGAVWIADMYRAVIEHPEYIPKDWQERLNLRAGEDMGRIYRVYPVGTPPRQVPRLDRLNTAGLVAALDSPNGPLRDMVQGLLLWRGEKAAAPFLAKLATTCGRGTARLQALCTLDGLGALDEKVLLAGLADAEPGVRRHAIRLSEPWLARSPEVAAAALALVSDADAQVRLQLAYSLGEWGDRRAGQALGRIALADSGDIYIAAAVMSSISSDHLDSVVETVLAGVGHEHPVALFQKLLTLATAFDNHQVLVRLLAALAEPKDGTFEDWQVAALAGLLDTLDRRNLSLAKFQKDADEGLKAGLNRLAPMFAWARETATKDSVDPAARAAATSLLGRGPDREQADVDLLAGLLVPQSSAELQAAAVAALAKLDDARVPTLLLANWKGSGPEVRGQVLDALMRRGAWLTVLLDDIAAGHIAPGEIDAARRQRLVEHRDNEVRARAEKLLAVSGDSDRRAVIEKYRAALTSGGDRQRGKAIFKKSCSVCHRLEDIGTEVGPDLAALTDKGNETMLVAILDPNRAVESKFINYTAATTGGLTYTGMLASETGASVTLVGQEGKQATILRSDLAELASSSKSLMPEGLEKDISPAEFSDLAAYLSGIRPPRRVFAGNEPKIVEPEGFRGEFWLLASDCEIYGSTLTFEPLYRNLGMWGSENDHAVWTFEVTQPGKYIVRLDCACAPEVAGNGYQLLVGDATLAGKAPSTGNWDTYRQVTVGVVALKAGRQQVVLRPAGKLTGYLMDLKSVRITPVATD
ncbi:MAG: c-type cytochrome [Planctomycetia bacterium]|nr:c-type cytochrome [Planctomycetia bacterium]